MAKKVQKGKPVKKAAKPAKKAVVKKAASKKVASKKAAKPVKKVIAKKVAPKKVAKPAKKSFAKKVTKPAKKVVAKKVTKPAKKVVAKKIIAKKVIKPVKKVVAKKIVKPVAKKVVAKKIVAKPIAKKVVAKPVAKVETKKAIPAKPIVVAKPIAAVAKKIEPVLKKKKNADSDWDEETTRGEDEPMVVEYKTPSIHRPIGPVPKPHLNTDKRTRYTDVELKEFKLLILKKLEEAQKDYELLKSTLSHKDDHGTDDTSPTFKLLEDGSDVLSKEETAHLAGRQEKFIQNLQNALIRVENKTYGICRVTGKLISKERLRSVPHATLAIEAKLEQSV